MQIYTAIGKLDRLSNLSLRSGHLGRGTNLYTPGVKMKVLFVAGIGNPSGSVFGGQAAMAQTLLRSPLPTVAELEILDSTMKSIPPPPLLYRFAAALLRIFRYCGHLRLFRPDVVLIFAADGFSLVEKSVMALLGTRAGCGVVIRISGGGLPDQCRRGRFMRWVTQVAIRNSDKIICQSASWRDFFGMMGMSPAKGKIVPNWIDTSEFLLFPAAVDNPEPIRILFLGWMERRKGVFELVDALEIVLPSYPGVKVVLAGGGKDLETLRIRIKEKGLERIISAPGWITGKTKRDLLLGSQIFVLPTYFEGLPNSLLEAMAAGAAVITTPVGGIPEVVSDGINGLLIPPKDAKSLTESLERVLNDATFRCFLGHNGRKTIVEGFSMEKRWGSFVEVLNEAAAIAGKKSRIQT